ncbi:S8 family serine peptidase [uncultured Jatrophihabitans sp.]|uniref:S8 family serine peptidase n=1 Tax=uncultured Jatrophihabitans sp. TaxID=1610747 RepID=UPI0035C9485F
MRRVVPVLAVAVTAAALSAAVVSTPAGARAVPSPATHGHAVAQHLASGFWRHHRQASVPRHSATPKPLTAAQQLTRSLNAARGSSTEVTLTGTSATALADAVRSTGGQVLGSVPGEITAAVSKTKVSALRKSPAVTGMHAPEKAWTHAGPTSEGVTQSEADTWQSATPGDTGSGVTIGIVDAGFGNLSGAIGSGDLPAGTTVDNYCGTDVDDTDHGTAVAEIVHQMAPGATLNLYCVTDNVTFNDATTQAISDGVSIVNCSLGFDGDARGDGTGPSDSASAAVARARKAGILWVESAGNDAQDHWSGTFADVNRDSLLDITGTDIDDDEENDGVFVPGADDVSGGGSADFVLRWDQWPTSSADVTFEAFGEQCDDDDCDTTTPINSGNPTAVQQSPGTAPVLDIPITDTNATPQIWYLEVELGSGFPKVHYDLNYEGDVGQSEQAQNFPARAAAGSIEQPADSPFVFSVGAADVGADHTPQGVLEDFSAQGPTVDSRVKPDITGWDGVSSPEYGTPDAGDSNGMGFYGTSASSPHVAGAAALVKAADSSFDAAQIQNFLEQRASRSTSTATPLDPPSNQMGHGLLTLGPTPAASPVAPAQGSGYQAVAPKRLLDTRTSTGGHHAKLGAAGTATVTVQGLPTDATAVAVNLTGTGATAGTYLTVYPYGSAYPGTDNLNLNTAVPTAAQLAIVPVRDGKFVIRNGYGTVDVVADEVGYFGTDAGRSLYTAVSPANRVLNTRDTTGGHKGVVAPNKTVTVDPAVPAGATAAVVNVTSADTTASGYLSAAPTCSSTTSTLNFGRYVRANLAVVGLSGDGTFCITDRGSSADVIVDVIGYLAPGTGAQYVPLPSAYRIVDTRTGNGGNASGHPPAPIPANRSAIFYGANVGDVPAGATALFTGAVEASTTASSYLYLFAGSTLPSAKTSNLNFGPGRVVSNSAVVGLSGGHQFGVYNYGGNTQAALDVFGYFRP